MDNNVMNAINSWLEGIDNVLDSIEFDHMNRMQWLLDNNYITQEMFDKEVSK